MSYCKIFLYLFYINVPSFTSSKRVVSTNFKLKIHDQFSQFLAKNYADVSKKWRRQKVNVPQYFLCMFYIHAKFQVKYASSSRGLRGEGTLNPPLLAYKTSFQKPLSNIVKCFVWKSKNICQNIHATSYFKFLVSLYFMLLCQCEGFKYRL